MTPDIARRFTRSEAIGALFIMGAGSCLHFVYAWSGYSKLAAVFGAVNESTWEHLKMAFWPAVSLALAQFILWGSKLPNLVPAKTVGVCTMLLVIVAGAFGIEVVFHEHFLVIDVALFVFAILAGQYLSWCLVVRTAQLSGFSRTGAAVLLALALAFAVFTFAPPQRVLFQDPVTGSYGIQVPRD